MGAMDGKLGGLGGASSGARSGGGGGASGPGTFDITELYTEAERTADVGTNNIVISLALTAIPKRGTKGRLKIRTNEGSVATPEHLYYCSDEWDWSDWLDLPTKLQTDNNAEETMLLTMKRGQSETSNSSAVAAIWVGRIDDTHVHLSCSHWADYNRSMLTIVQERPTGGKGDKGDPGGGVIDVSGMELENPVEGDRGTLWTDAYLHDMYFPVRRFRATTQAFGGGTDIADIDFTQNDRPRPTASGEVWFKPSNDYVYISGAGNIWFSTQWRFSSIGTALSIPYTGYTSVEYIGQFDTADDAANSIRAADYEATTQYIWYDRNDTRIKYLSVYVAPNTQVPYWDVVHVLTDENRITPHPVADKWTGTLVADEAMETTILSPEIGWVEIFGSVGDDEFSFSVRLPTAELLALDEGSAGDPLEGGASGLRFAVGTGSEVAFGHLDGFLLIEGPAGTASVTVYN